MTERLNAPLHYAGPDVATGHAAPRPSPSRRCGWRIAILSVAIPLLGLFYVLYVGNNRWRVSYHHGVELPASARDFHCTGATALSYWLGDHSAAQFTIDPADLPRFLKQFTVGDLQPTSPPAPGQPAGGYVVVGTPWAGPVTADGEMWGPSPTGTDFYGLSWHTTPDGVRIRLATDWN